jgi:signal transduction histidine kinase/CheY-like chemotaxis protein
VREVEVYGSTVQMNGRPALVGTLLDITERKRAERDRARLQQELGHAQKMECVGRLAGGIAHDFNNLMSVILMHSGSALDDLTAKESVEESLTAIQEVATRAVNLGRQLMVFSSKQVGQAEVLDLNSVIADSQKLLRRLIGEDVKVVFQPGPALFLVRADRGQIGQIVMNLAVNSRDAMPEGGTFTVETAAVQLDSNSSVEAEPGSYVMLSVRDTGTGMDQETRARVFEPFFTTKEVDKGTGLGLAVVYGIVKQNGGFITVASEPGQGCEFKIYLPLVPEIPKPASFEKETPISGGWETILVVEDEPALRGKIQDLLKQAGYEVVPAPDGDHASRLSLMDARPIHLLLTDVVMPGMSGFRLADRLHTLRPYTKVLYMSGYPAGRGENIDVASLPNFIQKPFTKERLLRMVRDVLDGKIPQDQRSTG